MLMLHARLMVFIAAGHAGSYTIRSSSSRYCTVSRCLLISQLARDTNVQMMAAQSKKQKKADTRGYVLRAGFTPR
jgi:hypothetical protein